MKKIIALAAFAMTLFFIASCDKQKKTSAVSSENEWWKDDSPAKNGVADDKDKAAEKEYRFVNTKDGLNVRSEPNGAKVCRLSADDRVEIIGRAEYDEIDGYRDRWLKVRTDAGTEGYVFGAYLSESLEKAAEFRIREKFDYFCSCMEKVDKWILMYEDKFRRDGYNIDTNPYNIAHDDYGEESFSLVKDGISFTFYRTLDRETGKGGIFLYWFDIPETSGFRLSELVPFEFGDTMQKVEENFGKPNGDKEQSLYDELMYVDWGNGLEMHPHVDEYGAITSIMFKKTGW